VIRGGGHGDEGFREVTRYTLPEGANEGVCGWEPHTFFCENCVDLILSEQHSRIYVILETTFAVAAANMVAQKW